MPKQIYFPLDEVAARYRTGESLPELARAYSIGTTTVWRRLRNAGIKMRSCGLPRGFKMSRKPGGPFADDGSGYLRTYDREGKPCRIHRGCWEAYWGTVPEGHDVHHRDEDRQNNVIENLALMTQAEHAKLHWGIRKEWSGGLPY